MFLYIIGTTHLVRIMSAIIKVRESEKDTKQGFLAIYLQELEPGIFSTLAVSFLVTEANDSCSGQI